MNKKYFLLLLSIPLLIGCNYNDRGKSVLDVFAEKEEVINTINQLFISTDNRDWEKVKEVFADSVYFDMTSLAGSEPLMLSSQDIVDAWDKGLKPLKAVHHQIGNYVVNINETESDVFCYGIAMHYLPNETGKNVRTFVGSYDFTLNKFDSGWKITNFKFNLKYIDGNLELENS